MSRIPRGLSHFDPCLPWRCHPSQRPGFPARRRHCGQSSPAKVTGGKKTTAFGKPSKCAPPTPTGSFGPKPAAGQPANPSRPSPCRGRSAWRSDSRSGSGSPKRCHMAETPADAPMPATFAVELPKLLSAGARPRGRSPTPNRRAHPDRQTPRRDWRSASPDPHQERRAALCLLCLQPPDRRWQGSVRLASARRGT